MQHHKEKNYSASVALSGRTNSIVGIRSSRCSNPEVKLTLRTLDHLQLVRLARVVFLSGAGLAEVRGYDEVVAPGIPNNIHLLPAGANINGSGVVKILDVFKRNPRVCISCNLTQVLPPWGLKKRRCFKLLLLQMN